MTTTKKWRFLAIGLAFMLTTACNSTKDTTTATTATAQPAVNPATAERPAGPRGRQGGGARGQAQMQELVASLGLNQDQEEEFKAINAKYQKQMQAMREEANGDFASMRGKMQELRTAQNDEIKEILTAEQITKYEKFLAERRNNRQGGRRPGGN